MITLKPERCGETEEFVLGKAFWRELWKTNLSYGRWFLTGCTLYILGTLLYSLFVRP